MFKLNRSLVAVALSLALAWGVSAALDGAVTEAAPTTILHETFDSTPLGPLGAPWSVSKSSNDQANIVTSTGHGRALLVRGGKATGDTLTVSRDSQASATEIVAQVEIKRAPGSTFIWSLHGAGSSIGRRRIRLQLEAGADMLVSQTVPSGSVACGNVPPNVWTTVTLKVHASTFPHTFDVLINGKPTACTGISSGLSKPFTYVDVMEPSNEGWGGDVYFDNIDVSTP